MVDIYSVPKEDLGNVSELFPTITFNSATFGGVEHYTMTLYEQSSSCSATVCCRANFEIRKENNDFIDNIAFSFSNNDTGSCDTLSGCFASCDDLFFDWNDSLGIHYPDLLKRSSNTNEDKVFQEQNKIVMYPNPAIDLLTININGFDSNSENHNLIIFDVLGKEYFRKSISTSSNQVNVSFLKKGTYFICYENNFNKYYLKFIKE